MDHYIYINVISSLNEKCLKISYHTKGQVNFECENKYKILLDPIYNITECFRLVTFTLNLNGLKFKVKKISGSDFEIDV